MNRDRVRKTLVVLTAALVAMTTWVWVHWTHVADISWRSAPTFKGACQRIQQAGLPPVPGDWWCTAPDWHWNVDNSLGLLLSVAGLALASAILAAAGLRLAALIPVLIWPFPVDAGSAYFDGGLIGLPWGPRAIRDIAILALPAVAVMVLTPRPDRLPHRWSMRRVLAHLLAAGVILIGVAGIAAWTWASWKHHQGFPEWVPYGGSEAWSELWPFLPMVAFGALLGTRRPWWPWSLPAVAFLLSGGPADLVRDLFPWDPEHWVVWTSFGLVLPLTGAGLLASSWQPIVERRMGHRSREQAPTGHPATRIAVAVVAAALVLGSMGMYWADPVPAQANTALPTFLGLRDRANDQRAKMNLAMGLEALVTLSGPGTASEASRIQPQLAWADGIPAGEGSRVLGILSRDIHHRTRLITLSGSGRWFCAQPASPGPPTYGEGASPDEAIANCRDSALTNAAIEPVPLPECDDASNGFIICRMVAVLVHNIQATPTPD